MKDSTYIRQVLSIHQSMDIARYFVTILLREYAKGLNTGSKLLKSWKGMGGLKEEKWIFPFHKREKLKRQNGSNYIC